MVVDNHSTDGTRAVVERFAGRYPNVRYAYEEKLGSSSARNRGWKEAVGEYIAFIDDDAKAPAEWLQVAENVIRDHTPDVFGGPVYPFYISPKPVWYKDKYATFSNGDLPRILSGPNEFFSGSNLFIRRRLLEDVGGFDERLGMFGNRLGYGEETAFLSQVRSRNSDAIIYYEPKLYTFHLIRPEKYALSWQLRSHLVLGRYNYQAYGDNVPKLQVRHVLGFFALPVVIAWEATLGVLLRKRSIFPYYQNYVIERIYKDISTWGKLYQRMLQVFLKKIGPIYSLKTKEINEGNIARSSLCLQSPTKVGRILAALRQQNIDRLVVFVDGPRTPDDQAMVEACQQISRSVAWVEKELHFSEQNSGSRNLHHNIGKVFEQYPAAIFLEDDCLPMPGFYAYMRQALAHYGGESQVFSIGGYQPIAPDFFSSYPYTVVGGARFIGWGWATWGERWQEIAPYLEHFSDLFDGFQHVPEIAGPEMLDIARTKAQGKLVDDWDFRVIATTLWLKKLHVLPVHGLVRNIGLDRSGTHGSLLGVVRDFLFHNRNVANSLPVRLAWPDRIELDCDYAFTLHDFIIRSRLYSSNRLKQRAIKLVRRFLVSGYEHRFDLDLLDGPHEPMKKRALLAYIVHPFSIPRDDPRFLGHNNIWYTHTIVKILNRLGYKVDVIDYQDTSFSPQSAYDLFIGHGGINYTIIAQALPAQCPKIYFSTSAYWQFHNQQEKARFDQLKQRRGVSLALDRYIFYGEDAALDSQMV